MAFQVSQTALLRFAAFLIDTLSIALLLVLPASILSYVVAWLGGSTRAINIVWVSALVILLAGIVVRDGLRGGRSPGKTLFGLMVSTPSGRPCGIRTSILRNLPLIIPFWNLLEVLLLISGKRRTGDRMARTNISEE